MSEGIAVICIFEQMQEGTLENSWWKLCSTKQQRNTALRRRPPPLLIRLGNGEFKTSKIHSEILNSRFAGAAAPLMQMWWRQLRPSLNNNLCNRDICPHAVRIRRRDVNAPPRRPRWGVACKLSPALEKRRWNASGMGRALSRVHNEDRFNIVQIEGGLRS